MTIETDFNDALDSDADVNNLVSGRNYIVQLPQSPTYPNTVTTFDRDIQNNLTGENGLDHALVQVDCRAQRYSDAVDLANKVKSAIAADTRFRSICDSMNDFPYEQGIKYFRIVLRFSVWQY